MDDKVKCVGGPYDGRYVSSRMSDRWPWVLSHDSKGHYMLGYYERDGDHFQWTGETEAITPDGESRPV